jgi:acyl carrier protein
MEPPPKAEILREIQLIMKELFELDPTRVQPEARLIEDLELDSIDAMDLAVKVEEKKGIAFDETQLRSLRTIADVIVALETMIKAHDGPLPTQLAAQTDR